MPKHKKKFISKKNAVTFQLVHRSQQDPLAADETAPQHVLLQQSSKKNLDEEHKYGIFFDDEYDYMQHLKNSSDATLEWEPVNYHTNTKVKSTTVPEAIVQLPSSVFASEVEEPVGLLNKAAPIHGPRPDLDPDIVAALDDDFDYEDPDNILEDNFIELANKNDFNDYETEKEYEAQGYNNQEYEEQVYEDDEDEEDEMGSLDNHMEFREVETKSRFTDYSMTSSVMRRNEQLSLLDRRFEQMLKGYEESEIGALDCEEIEGTISMQDRLLLDLAGKALEKQETEETRLKDKILSAVSDDSFSEEEMDEIIIDHNKEKWDCESILSTYSNLYNHPAKIIEPKGPPKIRVSKKTGIPLDVIGGKGGARLTAHTLSLLDSEDKALGPKSVLSQISELSIRPKNETLEDKKVRKKNLKVYRQERRMERKANTMAFKEEQIRQQKVMLNLKSNLQGFKMI